MSKPMRIANRWRVLLATLPLAICSVAQAQPPGPAAPDEHVGGHAEPQIKAGQQIYPTCARCHGNRGLGTPDGSVPAIAGQYGPVIIEELIDARPRYGNRNNPVLSHIASLHLISQPRDLADVAYYVSTMPRGRVPAAGSGKYVDRGKTLYQRECAGCHGSSAQGNEQRRVPWLDSQHYQYLRREITQSLEHQRPNMDKDHAKLFSGLSPEDVDGLADYLSRLPPS